jgi:pimeloyl-ACP methyl ester carboxylesterase
MVTDILRNDPANSRRAGPCRPLPSQQRRIERISILTDLSDKILSLRAAPAPLTERILRKGGSDDRLLPPRHSQQLLEAIPRARGTAIEASGHNPMVDAQELFAQSVSAFIDGL